MDKGPDLHVTEPFAYFIYIYLFISSSQAPYLV